MRNCATGLINASLPEGCMRSAVGTARYRQVFGLAGVVLDLLAVASQSLTDQCLSRRSFLLTAAGQSRIRTGFPLARPALARATASINTVTRGATADRLYRVA